MEQGALDYLMRFPRQTFPKNAYIAKQGQAVEYIYYLAEGRCVRNVFTVKGDEIIYDERVANQSASCLLGALTLYCPQIIHETNFIAQTPCICCKIYARDFLHFLSLYPSVLHELLTMAMSSYQHINANFQAKQKGQAACRVAGFLLDNAHTGADGLILDKHFTISEIGRYLGMHRVTVSKIILALCDQKALAHTADGLALRDENALQSYADGCAKLDYLRKPPS